MNKCFFEGLVSPKTGVSLQETDGELVTADGKEHFAIQDGIAILLDISSLDGVTQHEIDVFDNLDIRNVPYFRTNLYKNIMAKVSSYLERKAINLKEGFRVVEMGGGEGHWASYVKKEYPHAEVFTCDLSLKTLESAPKKLRRVCADVTQAIFEKGSIHLASFWVSLHHLEKRSISKALEEAVDFLVKDGILIVFEPNSMFWPRQIMYRSRLSRDVYPDEQEQAVEFSDLTTMAERFGLVEVETCFLNPPYNLAFLKKLKRWYFYMPIVECLYQVDRWINKYQAFKKYLALYGFAIYRKSIE